MSLLQSPCRPKRSGYPVASQLKVLIALAVRLNMLTLQVEACLPDCPAAIDRELARLAGQFDGAYLRALKLGTPLNTDFTITDGTGCHYLLRLISEGVEYHLT